MKERPLRLRRRFLGKVLTSRKDEKGNTIDPIILKIENAHLKAYLKGRERFRFGKTLEGQPAYYPVKQEYYEE